MLILCAADPIRKRRISPNPPQDLSAGFFMSAHFLQIFYKIVGIFLHLCGIMETIEGERLRQIMIKMRGGRRKEATTGPAPTRKRGKTCKRLSL